MPRSTQGNGLLEGRFFVGTTTIHRLNRVAKNYAGPSSSNVTGKAVSLQNRVTPMADIIAAPERGLFTGNRGILHDARTRTLLKRRWTSQAWLICALQWRGIRRTVMGPGSWTELFFLDVATALAAGHRPCFFCRRAAAKAFQAAFPKNGPTLMARDIDRVLHAERLDGRHKRLHDLTSSAADLPDGTMILQDDAPHVVQAGVAHPWSLNGYGIPTTPRDCARLITPPSAVMALRRAIGLGFIPARRPARAGVPTCPSR
jgi:hypothetical protein